MAKGKYINLSPDPIPRADGTEVKFSLDSQVVQMRGKRWGWVWNRPRGILLEKGREQRRIPIIDITRWVEAFLYGLSVVLVTIGVIKRLAGNGGKTNGR